MFFRFNTQAFSESGKHFLSSKMSNSDSLACFYPLEVSFPEKNFEKFFTSPPYCVVTPKFSLLVSIFKRFLNNLTVLKALARALFDWEERFTKAMRQFSRISEASALFSAVVGG
jgi:hypothetical protein